MLDTTKDETGYAQRSTSKGTPKRINWKNVDLQGARRQVRSTVWRSRRQLIPHAAAGAVAGIGFAARAIIATGGASAPVVALAVATIGGIGSAGLWKWVKSRRPRWANRVLVAGVAATAWLTTTPFGLTYEQAAILVVTEYTLGAAWWRANRIGAPKEHPKPESRTQQQPNDDVDTATVVDEDPLDDLARQIIMDWDTFVACNSGAAPGSVISNPQQTKHTIVFDGIASRGKQTAVSVRSALPLIASGLHKRAADLIVETDPTAESEAEFTFQVVTNSPIRGNVEFDGPRRHGGILDLGPFADGNGEAPYRLYTPGSMWSGVIIGGTGIGKSRLVENIVVSALAGGDTIYIYIDPQRGVSSPALAQNAHWFVTMDDVDELLDAILAGMAAREEENAAEGWTGFTPSPRRPGILVVAEECHNVFARGPELWAKIGREGRKLGFALLAISQYPGLETFGNKEALRSSVMEGNAFVLRSTSKQTGPLMAGLQVNPLALPKIPGYAYVNGSEENGIRTAPFRNRNTKPLGMSDKDATAWLTKWIQAQPVPELDTLVTTAIKYSTAGEAYAKRGSSTGDRQAAARARVEALRAGRNPNEVAAPTAETTKVPAPAGPLSGPFDRVLQFPPALTAEQVYGKPAQPMKLSESQQAILEVVTGGASRPVDVQAATGLSHRRVAELLKELVDAGYLVQPKYGRYQRAA